MKTMAFFTFFAILIDGCDILKTKSNGNGGLTATFSISDTTGHASTVFHSGDHFMVSFSLANTTNDTLTYGYTGTPIRFRILQDGREIASSTDGVVFLQYVQGGFIAPGDTFAASWKAPNTQFQNPKVVLMPGTYQATVLFSQVAEARVATVLPITFSVVQ